MEDNIRSDSRFSHIANDPRFKRIPKTELKVKIGKRFQSMFSDDRFKLKYTFDKRGRPGQHTSSEDLKKYYDLSTESESSSCDEDDDSEEGLKDNVKKSESVQSEGELSEAIKGKLHDPKVDYARGEADLLSDSSSDEESSEDELEAEVKDLDHGWGELDKDAEQTDEITNRLAVCNMDWDRIRSSDLMVLFSSFLQSGGLIHSVSIYPSEYGMERMKEEEASGPVDLLGTGDVNITQEIEDKRKVDDESEEGDRYHMEKLRQYQLTRLKYYYAVVTFDSPLSANTIYAECDGMEYESSATRLDLRFIPDDTTFEQEPREVCDSLPEPSKYQPRHFTTTALQQAKVELTWDETDPKRSEISQKIAAGTADDADIETYLAFSSGDEMNEPQEFKKYEDEGAGDKYRALLQGLEVQEEEKKYRSEEMQVTWGLGLKQKTQKLVDKKIKQGKALTPFQELIEKKKAKKSLKRKERQKKEDDNLESGDDIPSDIDMDDPYFKEEMQSTETNKKKIKKRKTSLEEVEDDEETKKLKAELELLLMENDDNRNHFSMKKIQENEAETGSKKKHKMKKKAEKVLIDDDFQMNVKDNRFSALFTSHHFNVDPTDPHYRKTKGMEALLTEKLTRRLDEDHIVSKISDVEAKKLKDSELSLLVKSVKRKAKSTFET